MTAQERQSALSRGVAALNAWLVEHHADARVELIERGLIGRAFHYALRVYALEGEYAGQEVIHELGPFSQALGSLEAIHVVWATVAAIEG